MHLSLFEFYLLVLIAPEVEPGNAVKLKRSNVMCVLSPRVKNKPVKSSKSGSAAQGPYGKMWPIHRGDDVLKYLIINSDELKKVDLNGENIRSWAQKWNQDSFKMIPKLLPTSDPDHANIRIEICKCMHA